jgi:hypothetical protein
MDLKQ